METALKIQMDIKNNVQDLQNYMLDLNNWEEEMKRKELSLKDEKPHASNIPPPRNKIKRSKPENEKNYSNKPKKISAYDYTAWDKFDVDKACAEVDETGQEDDDKKLEEEKKDSSDVVEADNSNEDDKNLSLIDEAFYEKEMGNKFVKKEQWADAIKCYTNAINLDSKNAIYYANRSLCFLKMKNFKSAEVDATVAIQLDKNYVKAYQRRAFVRLALGQLKEAKSDYEEVLKLEPKNALARVEINKIDEKLKSDAKNIKPEKKTFNHAQLFKSEEKKPKGTKVVDSSKEKPIPVKSAEIKTRSVTTIVKRQDPSDKSFKNEKQDINPQRGDGDKAVLVDTSKLKSGVFKPLPEWCEIVHPINIPPHKRSKKPLKKIEIVEIDKDEDFDFLVEPKTSPSSVNTPKEEIKVTIEKQDDSLKNERLSCDIPQTAIQFQNCWKILKKDPEEAYLYLKKIPGEELPQIFDNSLESDFFSELITFLASDKVRGDYKIINDFLVGFSKVKRFSSLILFLSSADRACLKKCLAELENMKSKEEISELSRLYEL